MSAYLNFRAKITKKEFVWKSMFFYWRVIIKRSNSHAEIFSDRDVGLADFSLTKYRLGIAMCAVPIDSWTAV